MAAIALFLVVLVARPPGVGAADCTEQEVKVGIVTAKGCFTQRTPQGDASPVYETTAKFQMNGFAVAPRDGAKVTFAPADSKRGAYVTTNNGFVDLSAVHHVSGAPVNFNFMNFAFSPPNSGEMILAESALAQPAPVILGLSPLGVKQPIRLTAEGAEFDLHFGVEGIFKQMLTGSTKELTFGIGYTVADGQYAISKGTFHLGEFELAHLLDIRDATLEFGSDLIDVDMDAALKPLSSKGLVAGATFQSGALTRVTLGLSGLNKPLGSSGIYLQKLAGTAFIAPPFGGSGTIELTAGPKVEFLGKEVDSADVTGTVTIKGADVTNNKPGFFSVAGDLSLVTIPVSSAHFAYYFGQGTDFGATIGIGFPSGTNDPGQPTYLGGSFNGWTTAQHFDLEGNASLKLVGINIAGAKTVVSDIGFAGCVQLGLWVGGGLRWSNGQGELLGGWTCNIGGYQPSRQSAVARAERRGSATINLDEDDQVVRVWAPDGADAPQVSLEEVEGDRSLSTPDPVDEDGVVRSDDGVAVLGEEEMSGFVIPGDASGRWRLNVQPGSSSIDSIETAARLPDHEVRARVAGHGRDRVLRWRSRDIPYQVLQFSEVLPNGREVLIHQTRKHRGSFRFRPTEGPGTWGKKRKLAVDVMQRLGTPRDELVADTYRIRRRPAPGMVRHLEVERRLNDVIVSWRRAGGAARHEVKAKAIGAGATYRELTGRRSHRVRLEGLGSSKRMRVSVVAINGQGRPGKAAITTLDTDGLVRTRRAAARGIVAGAELVGRRVVTHPECPEPAECEISLRVTSGGSLLGSAHLSLPPDMTDRMTVRLPSRARRGDLRLVARVAQMDESATSRGPLR